MTLENTIKKIKTKIDELEDLRSNLQGMTINFEGNYAVINDIDYSNMTADLYLEYENGDSDFLNITLDGLLRSIK